MLCGLTYSEIMQKSRRGARGPADWNSTQSDRYSLRDVRKLESFATKFLCCSRCRRWLVTYQPLVRGQVSERYVAEWSKRIDRQAGRQASELMN